MATGQRLRIAVDPAKGLKINYSHHAVNIIFFLRKVYASYPIKRKQIFMKQFSEMRRICLKIYNACHKSRAVAV